MGKERRCTHGCSDGYEKMRGSSGVKEAAKSRLRLFLVFFFSSFFKQIIFKQCIDHMMSWCASGSGRVGDSGHSVAFFPPFRYFLLHSLTQFAIVRQKEMKSLSPLTKPFKIILERPVIMIPLK